MIIETKWTSLEGMTPLSPVYKLKESVSTKKISPKCCHGNSSNPVVMGSPRIPPHHTDAAMLLHCDDDSTSASHKYTYKKFINKLAPFTERG